MAQQTAVDWLMENIQKVHKMDWDIIWIRAREMEKQQIIDAFDNGTIDEDKIGNEYYTETFKN